jgi:hypothetical protein
MAMLHRTVRKRFGVDGAAFGERSHGVGGSGDALARCPPGPSSFTLTKASASPKDLLTPSTPIMAPEVGKLVLVVMRSPPQE